MSFVITSTHSVLWYRRLSGDTYVKRFLPIQFFFHSLLFISLPAHPFVCFLCVFKCLSFLSCVLWSFCYQLLQSLTMLVHQYNGHEVIFFILMYIVCMNLYSLIYYPLITTYHLYCMNLYSLIYYPRITT